MMSRDSHEVGVDSLVVLFDRRARHNADRVALQVKRKGVWQPITWREYLAAAQTATAALAELGVGAGTRLTLATHPCPQALYVEMAAQALGAKLFVVDPAAPAAQLERRLAATSTDVLVGADETTLGRLPEWAGSEAAQHVTYPELFQQPSGDGAAETWTKLLAAGPADVGGVFCSAGTTGPVRALEMTSAALVTAWHSFCQTYAVTVGDRIIAGATTRATLHRSAALTLPVLSGATLYFREHLQSVEAAAREIGPTVVVSLPSEWQARADSFERRFGDARGPGRLAIKWLLPVVESDRPRKSGRGLRSLLTEGLVRRPIRRQLGWGKVRIACVGGATMRTGLAARWARLGMTLHQFYAVADAGTLVALESPARRGQGSVDGWLTPTSGRIVASDSPGTAITVTVRGGIGTSGTGDVGDVDPDGRVRAIAREVDLAVDSSGVVLNLGDVEFWAGRQATVTRCLVCVRTGDELAGLIELDEEALRDMRADDQAETEVPTATPTSWETTVAHEVAQLIAHLNEWLAERTALRVSTLKVVTVGRDGRLVSETGDPCRHEIAAACADGTVAIHEMSGGGTT